MILSRGLPLRLEHASLQGCLVPCQIVNRAIRARLLANGLTVSTKWQPGLAFLLTPKSKAVSRNIPGFFLLHMVNLVGTGKAIYLMNALIKIISIHIITGQFSPAIIHQALWCRSCTLQGQYQISKLHTSPSSGNGEHRISNGKNEGERVT